MKKKMILKMSQTLYRIMLLPRKSPHYLVKKLLLKTKQKKQYLLL